MDLHPSPASESARLPAAARPARTPKWRAFWNIVTHFDPARMQPWMALRNTVGVVVPLVAGYLLGMPRGGLAMASGAMNVSYSDGQDPYAPRAKRMLVSTAWCSIAILFGALTGHHNVEAVAVATLWAFGAGMLVSLGSTAADVGVISTVMIVVYAAQPLTPRQAVEASLLALAGGLFQTLLSIALWPVRRYDPERRALARLFLALAGAAGKAVEALGSPPATAESSQAQDAISGLGSDNSIEALRYRSLLNQAERLRLSTTALKRLRSRIARKSADHPAVEVLDRYLANAAQMLHDLGSSLASGTAIPPESDRLVLSVALAYQLREDNAGDPTTFEGAVAKSARSQMDALSGQLRAALELASHTTPEGQAAFALEEARQPLWLRFGGKLATLRGNFNIHSVAFRHALRLAVCVAAGEALGRAFEPQRAYWIPMTIVLVLKPEFTTTFSRGILRIAGTVAGLLLATAMFHFLPIHTVTEIVMIALVMFLTRWVGPANYGVFAVSVSALVVLLLTINGVSPKEVIVARGINTAAGGALALVAYAVWPTWERKRVPELFALLLEAYRVSFQSIVHSYLDPSARDQESRRRARQSARTARTNLEASLERVAAEPGTRRAQLDGLNAMLASSHRFAHAMMALEAGLPQTKEVPVRPAFRAFSQGVDQTLKLLAALFRGERAAERDFPDLREAHNHLAESGDPVESRYALSNMEADRMTNSLNTLREQVTRSIRERQQQP